MKKKLLLLLLLVVIVTEIRLLYPPQPESSPPLFRITSMTITQDVDVVDQNGFWTGDSLKAGDPVNVMWCYEGLCEIDSPTPGWIPEDILVK